MTPRTAQRRPRPWHLWIAAIAASALYVGGARDFVLILLDDSQYIASQFGAAGIAYFTDYPWPLRVVWAITIIGGLAAPALLLALSPLAVAAAATATIAQTALLALTFALLDRWTMLGAMTSWFDIGVAAATALLTAYCEAMRRRGVLTAPHARARDAGGGRG